MKQDGEGIGGGAEGAPSPVIDKLQVGAAASALVSAAIGDIAVVASRSPERKHDSLADIARLDALLADDPASFEQSTGDADPQSALMARRQMEAQAAEHAAKLAAIDRQIAGKQAEARETEASIAKLQATLPLVSEQRDIRKSLLENEYGSRIVYLQVEQQVVEADHELRNYGDAPAFTHFLRRATRVS